MNMTNNNGATRATELVAEIRLGGNSANKPKIHRHTQTFFER